MSSGESTERMWRDRAWAAEEKLSAAEAEVARLREEGSERGWFCETCRLWDAPYHPEDSEGTVLIYRTCPQGHTMFAVTKDWVEKREARSQVAAVRAVRCTGTDWPNKQWPPGERSRYLDGWDACHKATIRALDAATGAES